MAYITSLGFDRKHEARRKRRAVQGAQSIDALTQRLTAEQDNAFHIERVETLLCNPRLQDNDREWYEKTRDWLGVSKARTLNHFHLGRLERLERILWLRENKPEALERARQSRGRQRRPWREPKRRNFPDWLKGQGGGELVRPDRA